MGLFEKWFLKDKTEKRGTSIMSMSEWKPFSALMESAGVSVSHKDAMKFSAVFAAIRIQSENIASLPKVIYEDTQNGKVSRKDHPVYNLIHYQPNPLMNDYSFWSYITACVNGWGNAYAVIETKNGFPVNLFPVHPSEVTPFVDGRELFYDVKAKPWKNTYSSAEILHFKLFSIDGVNGVDPITMHRQSIAVGLAGDKFSAQFFEKNGAIKGVLETDQSLGDKAYESFMKRFKGEGNHGTPLLEYGIKYKPVSISPDSAQALQTRQFQIQDVARIFNIPPHMLGDLSRSTFSNIEHQDIQYVKYSLRPLVKMLETEVEHKLFTSDERGKLNVKFNLDGLLRGDMAARSNYYHNAILDGYMTRNEVRELENMNPLPGLSEPFSPANMITQNSQNNGTDAV